MGEDGLDGADVVPKEARGHRIPKGNMRVFATMNPAATGGGRSKLPRGITNLFTKVTLKEYHPLELKMILNKICARQLHGQDASLDNTLLDGIFRVHEEVQELVHRRDIGRQGGPYEFNLRDCASPPLLLLSCPQHRVLNRQPAFLKNHSFTHSFVVVAQ